MQTQTQTPYHNACAPKPSPIPHGTRQSEKEIREQAHSDEQGRRLRRVRKREGIHRQSPQCLLHSRGADSIRFLPHVRVVWVPGVLGRDVGRGRARPL